MSCLHDLPGWMDLLQPSFRSFPVDILEIGSDVVGFFQTVIDHKGVLEDIQDQDGRATGQVSRVMFIDPAIEQISGEVVLV
jgi:hypothetical protein